MSKTFTDFSQLSKGLFKSGERPVEGKPQPKPSKDDAEVLAYFSHTSQNARKGRAAVSCADLGTDRERSLAAELEATRGELAASREAVSAAEKRIAELERKLAAAQKAHDEIERQNKRLKGECGRLMGELRKCAENALVAASPQDAPTAQEEAVKPARGLLAATGAIVEVFPGEVREQVLAALADACDAAKNSGRERRAAILSGILAANRSSGELDRRRAEVRQIIRDAGSFVDASTLSALGRLGIKCISGRNHWKLEYGVTAAQAGLANRASQAERKRVPSIRTSISKTPSDRRAVLNTATDLANRCF